MGKLRGRSKTHLAGKQKQTINLWRLGIAGLAVAGIAGIFQVSGILGVNDLHTTPSCGADNLHTLAWGSGANQYSWTAGSLTNTFENVDNSGVDFAFNYTGAVYKFGAIGSGQTPNTQDFFPSESIDALSHYVTSGFTGGENITLTIEFTPAIPGQLAFDFYHINGTAYSGDKVTTYAVPVGGGANIYPTVTDNGNASWSYLGNGIIDAHSASTSGTRGYAGVNYNSGSLIKQLVIIYEDCGICGNGVHGFGMGDIEFCAVTPTDTDNDNVFDKYDIDDDNDGITDFVETCGVSQAIPNSNIQIDIQFDDYASETSWTLKNASNTTVASGGPYSGADNNSLQTFSSSLTPGLYTFEISDSYGDGLSMHNGYYQIRLNGEVVVGPIENTGYSGLHQILVPVLGFSCLNGDPSEDDDDDGIVNYQDSDFCTLGSNGICQSLDTEGHGIPDYLDLDSDDDGIPDIVEVGGADSNGDGTVDDTSDSDGDGLANVFESGYDWTSNLLDANGDGTNEITGDFDGDNAVNWLDLDSDNDGIPDVIEAGGTDADDDAIIDGYTTDVDSDGFADGVDGDVGNDGTAENTVYALVATSTDSNGDGLPDSGYPNANHDNTGYPNFLDIDSDDDGITDNAEAQQTNGYKVPNSVDSDGDGINNKYDHQGNSFGGRGLDPINTDYSGFPDYLDIDSDDDGLSDLIEGHDTNGDGLVNGSDSPFANTGQMAGIDLDNDGLDDGFDNNTFGINPTNGGSTPNSHPKVKGGVNRDWRSLTLLPVDWLSLKIFQQRTDVLLSWQVAEIQNHDHFSIERSRDARQFEAVGKVQGHRQSNAQVEAYQFTDIGAMTSMTPRLYYRIKQVDLNGEFSYSKIVELENGALKNGFFVKVYPNPANDFLKVVFENKAPENFELTLIDMQGREVYQQKGQEKNSLHPVSQLPSGIYTLVISTGKSEHVESISIQH